VIDRLHTQQDWFDRLLPQGLPIPSVTLLSGPGGSGKPLIGNVIVAAWLRQGGSVIFMSLQYPDHSFIVTGLKRVAQLDLKDYMNRIAFIELDATLEDLTPVEGNWFKANVVKPQIWDAALERACAMVPEEGPGILIFASALNLLFFSPTYGEAILEKVISTAQGEKDLTYLYSVSTTAKAEMIAKLEPVVDHLVMTRSTKKPFQLYLKISRITGAPFHTEEIQVPIAADVLTGVKEIADHSRKRVIPLVSKL
jgi:KaiC/GvpD/RAD55 family RecA-like ATPase